GSRFGASLPKQFLPLAGRRVIDYSLEILVTSRLFAGIVLVLPQDFIAEWHEFLQKGPWSQVRVTAGGLTRQQSVQKGLQMVDDAADWILIHDAARPMLTTTMLQRTLTGAQETGAAVTAIPVADTLKRADDRQYVQKTVLRDRLY